MTAEQLFTAYLVDSGIEESKIQELPQLHKDAILDICKSAVRQLENSSDNDKIRYVCECSFHVLRAIHTGIQNVAYYKEAPFEYEFCGKKYTINNPENYLNIIGFD